MEPSHLSLHFPSPCGADTDAALGARGILEAQKPGIAPPPPRTQRALPGQRAVRLPAEVQEGS